MTKRSEKPEWVRVAEEYEESGLTQREFAQRRGMTLSTLQSWVYRRRRQEGAAVAQPVRLLPVQVTMAPVVSGSDSLEVLTASGERVRFAAGTDVEYVARLVAALGRKTC
jgi:transposase